MREILDDVERWLREGERDIAIATVITTWGSAPRGVGAKMAATNGGRVTGSISGGCVESAIIEEGPVVLATRRPKILHFETSDDTAWKVGLPCGGTIDVLVEPFEPSLFDFLKPHLRANARVTQVTVIRGPEELVGRRVAFGPDGEAAGTISGRLDATAREIARTARTPERTSAGDEIELFVDPMLPVATVVMIGGVHIAVVLAKLVQDMGYRAAVVDPRKSFGSADRFEGVDRLLALWPDEAFNQVELTPETALVVLTHDPKLDDPALEAALRSPVFYIGALGSARTQERRRARLLERGFTPAELERIHGPVGLDIRAAGPAEIALSILAEIVATARGAQAVMRKSAAAAGRT